MTWFRINQGACRDERIQELALVLDIDEDAALARALRLWDLGSKEAIGGSLAHLDARRIAIALRHRGDADALVAALVESRLISSSLVIDGWEEMWGKDQRKRTRDLERYHAQKGTPSADSRESSDSAAIIRYGTVRYGTDVVDPPPPVGGARAHEEAVQAEEPPLTPPSETRTSESPPQFRGAPPAPCTPEEVRQLREAGASHVDPAAWLANLPRLLTADGEVTLRRRLEALPRPARLAEACAALRLARERGKHPPENYALGALKRSLRTEGSLVHDAEARASPAIPTAPHRPPDIDPDLAIYGG